LLLRLSGSFLLRFAARAFLALLFQPPPRLTRLEPEDGPSGQNPKTGYNISSKTLAIGKAREFQQRFHVPDQFMHRPFTPVTPALVQPEFVDETPLAARREKNLLWKNTVAEKWDPSDAPVQLKIQLHLKGQASPQEIPHRRQCLLEQSLPVITKEKKIVHIPDVAAHLSLFLDPVIEDGQIKIGQVLRDQVANG